MKKIKSFDDLIIRLERCDVQKEIISHKLARKHDKLLDEIYNFIDRLMYGKGI